jgi:hypothetical protein
LESGVYVPVTDKVVTHWPAPDANGDGEEVWENQYDTNGNILGRFQAKDANGDAIYSYEPPEGFRNIPSSDGTDNYVRVTERGAVKRSPTGDAISIRPGETLVEYPDGSYEHLRDDFSRKLFNDSHERVGDTPKPVIPAKKAPAKKVTEAPK